MRNAQKNHMFFERVGTPWNIEKRTSSPPPSALSGFGWRPMKNPTCMFVRLILLTAFAAAVLFSASTLSAHAQSELVERQVTAAPGHDVRVGVYINIKSDCSIGPLPTIRLVAAPAHGAVSVKRATLKATNIKQCLGVEAPAFVAFYRAPAEFTGLDVFELEIGLQDGRKQRERIHVMVNNSAGASKGI